MIRHTAVTGGSDLYTDCGNVKTCLLPHKKCNTTAYKALQKDV